MIGNKYGTCDANIQCVASGSTGLIFKYYKTITVPSMHSRPSSLLN